MKTVAASLGVARSNIIERRDGHRPQRGPQERPGDVELAGAIRDLVDKRPTYGYRRIAALLRRERRAAGESQVNAKRVYRLMTALRSNAIPDAAGRASMTARWRRSARTAAGVRTRWSSPAETARSSASPSRWIAMTARSLAGLPAPPASPVR